VADSADTQNAMTFGRIERYDIEPCARGLAVHMRQRGRALAVALVSVAVLVVSWWFGPYGPRPAVNWGESDLFYWLWSGFFSLILILGLLGAFYQEDWTIAEHDISVTKGLGPWRTTRRVPRSRSLGIRIEILTSGRGGPIFPYRLRFLDAEQNDSGLRIELQLARSVDQFLEALRGVLTLHVEDPRSDRRTTG
jgi:hypothetical protein